MLQLTNLTVILISMLCLWLSTGTTSWQWRVLPVLRKKKHTATVFWVVTGWECRLVIYSWYLYGGPQDNHKNLGQDNRCPGPDSKPKTTAIPNRRTSGSTSVLGKIPVKMETAPKVSNTGHPQTNHSWGLRSPGIPCGVYWSFATLSEHGHHLEGLSSQEV